MGRINKMLQRAAAPLGSRTVRKNWIATVAADLALPPASRRGFNQTPSWAGSRSSLLGVTTMSPRTALFILLSKLFNNVPIKTQEEMSPAVSESVTSKGRINTLQGMRGRDWWREPEGRPELTC